MRRVADAACVCDSDDADAELLHDFRTACRSVRVLDAGWFGVPVARYLSDKRGCRDRR
jgi:hypothetical protein